MEMTINNQKQTKHHPGRGLLILQRTKITKLLESESLLILQEVVNLPSHKSVCAKKYTNLYPLIASVQICIFFSNCTNLYNFVHQKNAQICMPS